MINYDWSNEAPYTNKRKQYSQTLTTGRLTFLESSVTRSENATLSTSTAPNMSAAQNLKNTNGPHGFERNDFNPSINMVVNCKSEKNGLSSFPATTVLAVDAYDFDSDSDAI